MAWLILIAGPNGAGKTTLAGSADFQKQLKLFPAGPVRLFNPDEAAKVYYASSPGITVEAANLWATNAIPAQVVQCIDAGENIAVETVLSSDKYESVIHHAHSAGYQVGMIYLALESAKVSKARVAKRVATGGHPVPDNRLRPRWHRSLDNLVKFAPMLDGLLLFLSSSTRGLTLLAEKYEGQLLWYGGPLFPNLRQRLGAQQTPVSGPGTGGMPFRSKP
ncbi:MAG TPA: zeta toxin family protein [Candidatus Binataceae bacterium]|nr:zeta toxin family protein [Candidatus Binataceae bacterium]